MSKHVSLNSTRVTYIAGSGCGSNAILITADADIYVYGVNRKPYSTDGFLALPFDEVGT